MKTLLLGVALLAAPVAAFAHSAPPPPDANPAHVQPGTYSE